MGCKKNPLAAIACILVLIGALNWGLVGLGWLVGGGANWNVVNMLLGKWMQVEGVVYVLVGLAGVYKIVMCCGGKCTDSACPCGSGTCACGNPNCDGSCKK
jgi:uncharacterized protein